MRHTMMPGGVNLPEVGMPPRSPTNKDGSFDPSKFGYQGPKKVGKPSSMGSKIKSGMGSRAGDPNRATYKGGPKMGQTIPQRGNKPSVIDNQINSNWGGNSASDKMYQKHGASMARSAMARNAKKRGR